MKTKYTQGPWRIGKGNGEGSIFAKSGRMRLESGGTTLYPVCAVNHAWDEDADEDAANSKLIAAAPELLEALIDLFENCAMVHKHWGAGSNLKEADVAIESAKTAIAKAKGE